MATTIIRKISDADLKIIDGLATKKKKSREEYLRQLIHTHASDYYVNEDRENLAEVLEKNEEVLQQATTAINSLVAILKEK